MDVIVFPDAEALVVTWLSEHLAEREDDAEVATAVDPTRPARLVKVTRTGGARTNLVTDNPQITVECWAPETTEASDLASLVRGLLFALDGQNVDGAWVRSVTDVGGPSFFPDPQTDLPRYQLTVALNVRGRAL